MPKDCKGLKREARPAQWRSPSGHSPLSVTPPSVTPPVSHSLSVTPPVSLSPCQSLPLSVTPSAVCGSTFSLAGGQTVFSQMASGFPVLPSTRLTFRGPFTHPGPFQSLYSLRLSFLTFQRPDFTWRTTRPRGLSLPSANGRPAPPFPTPRPPHQRRWPCPCSVLSH